MPGKCRANVVSAYDEVRGTVGMANVSGPGCLLVGQPTVISRARLEGGCGKKSPRFYKDYTLPETNSSHLKMDGWNTIVSFLENPIFRGYISFRECNCL